MELKIAELQTRNAAPRSVTSALIAVLCFGCGITIGQNWFIHSHQLLIPSSRSRLKWSVSWRVLSRRGCGGPRVRRVRIPFTTRRAWRNGTRNMGILLSEGWIVGLGGVFERGVERATVSELRKWNEMDSGYVLWTTSTGSSYLGNKFEKEKFSFKWSRLEGIVKPASRISDRSQRILSETLCRQEHRSVLQGEYNFLSSICIQKEHSE